MTVNSTGNYPEGVTVSVIGEGGDVIASHDASSNTPFTFVVDSPKLWSPDSPTL
jgi:beta-galactosidase/beta-glucuronidase